MSLVQLFTKGIFRENPVFRMLLGLCPTLAVTTSAMDGAGMGLSTLVVLVFSNLAISLLKGYIPSQVRIPAFIVVIASFVTIVDLTMAGYLFSLHRKLGLFIPLIVVNCLILARAEAFASKNGPVASMADGIGMGLGFTLSLTALGAMREVLGSGSIFGLTLVGEEAPKALVMVLPPGGFIVLGLGLGLINHLEARRAARESALSSSADGKIGVAT